MDHQLDVFGQQPGLNRLYTQSCLCFSLHPDQREGTVQVLRTGLHKLMQTVPWLSGCIVYSEASKKYYIRSEDASELAVEDLSSQLPSMAGLKSAAFPAKYLNEEAVAPCKTIREAPERPAPVFLVQANMIEGGILLVICGLHSCMDMTGQGFITYLFAKACRGEAFSSEELREANNRGTESIPLLKPDEMSIGSALGASQAQKTPARPLGSHDGSATWSYILFSGQSLVRLKEIATETRTTEFVSTDDCLSAFLWQSTTRARSHRLPSADFPTAFTRTVDARKAAGVPANYTGNAAIKTLCSMESQDLLDSPLGAVASKLRESLQDIGHMLRNDATLLSQGRTPEKVSVDPSTGLNLSSWAREQMYEMDFGPLVGKPTAVRRPTFEAWESLVYLMPKRADGEIAVAICLRQDDLQRLKGDAGFAKYAQIVG